MKHIKKKMGFSKLSGQQLKDATGGALHCSCGCAYVDCGGSSSWDNGVANMEGGLVTPPDVGC